MESERVRSIEEKLKELEKINKEYENINSHRYSTEQNILYRIHEQEHWIEWLAFQLNKGKKDGDYKTIYDRLMKESRNGVICFSLDIEFILFSSAPYSGTTIIRYYKKDKKGHKEILYSSNRIPFSDFDKIEETIKQNMTSEAIDNVIKDLDDKIEECNRNLSNLKLWEIRLKELQAEKVKYEQLKQDHGIQ